MLQLDVWYLLLSSWDNGRAPIDFINNFFLICLVFQLMYIRGSMAFANEEALAFFFRKYNKIIIRLVFFFVLNHQFILFLILHFFLWVVSRYCYYVLTADHLSFCLGLDPRFHATWHIDKKFLAKLPYYPDINSIPSYDAPIFIDLIGLIEIYKAEGINKVERIFFYRYLDYVTSYVISEYILNNGDITLSPEHRRLVFRTLIEYRDMDWQSKDVLTANARLTELNRELSDLLMDYYALDKQYRLFLMYKDVNILKLQHSTYAQVAGLRPADFAWGRYSTYGLEEARKKSWDDFRDDPIRSELVIEYSIMDFDIMFGYLNKKISENVKEYNLVIKYKWKKEALDLEAAGIKELSYEDDVHYRTFAGEEALFRYAHCRIDITKYLQEYERLNLNKVITAYNKQIDNPKSFMEEFRENVDKEVLEKREAGKKRFYRKNT